VKTRRLLQLGAIAMWLLALAPISATFAAAEGGTTLDAYGWWNKQQALPVQGDPTGLGLTTVPTVPAPATVPADGMQVAADATGASAIAAVRYLAAGGGTLTLHVPDGTTLTGTEKLVACQVQGGFTASENGRWDAKPAYDETTCIVEGKLSEDKTSFTFDIPATFASALGDVSVVLAPAADATPFSVSFDKPSNDSFAVTTQVQSTPEVAPMPAYEPGTAVYTPPAASVSPSVALPPSPSVSTPQQGGSQVTTPAAVALPTSPAKSPSRRSQVVAVALLVVIGAALWRLAAQPQRAPRLLGSVGGAAAAAAPSPVAVARTSRPRGVGRFARPREAPPTAI
jgi:hypothetical protein